MVLTDIVCLFLLVLCTALAISYAAFDPTVFKTCAAILCLAALVFYVDDMLKGD